MLSRLRLSAAKASIILSVFAYSISLVYESSKNLTCLGSSSSLTIIWVSSSASCIFKPANLVKVFVSWFSSLVSDFYSVELKLLYSLDKSSLLTDLLEGYDCFNTLISGESSIHLDLSFLLTALITSFELFAFDITEKFPRL